MGTRMGTVIIIRIRMEDIPRCVSTLYTLGADYTSG